MNIARKVTVMAGMTVDQLRTKYAEVFGEPCRSRHKQWLIKRIAWRMQANEEGDLSERARRRATELANDADLRLTPPREPKATVGAAERTKTVSTDVRATTTAAAGNRTDAGLQRADGASDGAGGRFRMPRPAIQIAHRRRQGGHRQTLEWSPLLRPADDRR